MSMPWERYEGGYTDAWPKPKKDKPAKKTPKKAKAKAKKSSRKSS